MLGSDDGRLLPPPPRKPTTIAKPMPLWDQLQMEGRAKESRKRKASEESKDGSKKVKRSSRVAPDLSGNVIIVKVGNIGRKKNFSIDQYLLVKHSDYFKMMSEMEWKENKTGVLLMQEDDVAAFELFAGFVYTGKGFCNTPSITTGGGLRIAVKEVKDAEEFERRAHAWALGKKLLSTSFKDAVTDATIDRINTQPPLTHAHVVQGANHPHGNFPDSMHNIVWTSSTDGPRRMKKLLVDVAVHWCSSSVLRSVYDDEEVVKKFLTDVLIVTKSGAWIEGGGNWFLGMIWAVTITSTGRVVSATGACSESRESSVAWQSKSSGQ